MYEFVRLDDDGHICGQKVLQQNVTSVPYWKRCAIRTTHLIINIFRTWEAGLEAIRIARNTETISSNTVTNIPLSWQWMMSKENTSATINRH